MKEVIGDEIIKFIKRTPSKAAVARYYLVFLIVHAIWCYDHKIEIKAYLLTPTKIEIEMSDNANWMTET